MANIFDIPMSCGFDYEKSHRISDGFWSGDKEIRTLDPLLAKQVLYQLSYTPEYWL